VTFVNIVRASKIVNIFTDAVLIPTRSLCLRLNFNPFLLSYGINYSFTCTRNTKGEAAHISKTVARQTFDVRSTRTVLTCLSAHTVLVANYLVGQGI